MFGIRRNLKKSIVELKQKTVKLTEMLERRKLAVDKELAEYKAKAIVEMRRDIETRKTNNFEKLQEARKQRFIKEAELKVSTKDAEVALVKIQAEISGLEKYKELLLNGQASEVVKLYEIVKNLSYPKNQSNNNNN